MARRVGSGRRGEAGGFQEEIAGWGRAGPYPGAHRHKEETMATKKTAKKAEKKTAKKSAAKTAKKKAA